MSILINYKKSQKIFYSQVLKCNILGTIEVSIPVLTSKGAFGDFVGDSVRDYTTAKYDLKCLYKRTISDKDRGKFGIEKDVTAIIYVSPIQIKKLTGSIEFPNENKGEKIRIKFFGDFYDVYRIIEREPFVDSSGEKTSVSYEIRLKIQKGQNVE